MESVTLDTGDRVSWRTGREVCTGIVQLSVGKHVPNEVIRRAMGTTAPDYLVNLGRDCSAEERLIVSVTHVQAIDEWAPVRERFKGISIKTFRRQLIMIRKAGQKKNEVASGLAVEFNIKDLEGYYEPTLDLKNVSDSNCSVPVHLADLM